MTTDFTWTKSQFHIPDGIVAYLDGNSLGPLPRATAQRVAQTITDEWGELLITGWNKAGWMAQPTGLGDRIGRLIGAAPGTVTTGDTLSIKVYQAVAAALEMRPDRRVVLSDTGNFPSDLYMVQGLLRGMGRDLELVTVAPEAVADRIGSDVAVMMLTQVDYRTGRLHDMADLTAQAHAAGALTLWDLAHTAGALPVDLAGAGADFAVGCSYKYLNAGPGAPAFIYVAPDHLDRAQPCLQGWLGHAAPFAFDLDYTAGTGIERMRVGTPPVLQNAALEAALDIWAQVDMADVRAQSIALSERFIAGALQRCPELRLASPQDPRQRGSQVSFHHPEGYAAIQALIAEGVVGDFRAPDIMRFGITPLFIGTSEIDAALDAMVRVFSERLWDAPQFKVRAAVT